MCPRSNSTAIPKNIFLFSEKRQKQSYRPCFSTDFFKFGFKKLPVPHCVFPKKEIFFFEKMTSHGQKNVFCTSGSTTGSEQVGPDLFGVSKFFIETHNV